MSKLRLELKLALYTALINSQFIYNIDITDNRRGGRASDIIVPVLGTQLGNEASLRSAVTLAIPPI